MFAVGCLVFVERCLCWMGLGCEWSGWGLIPENKYDFHAIFLVPSV